MLKNLSFKAKLTILLSSTILGFVIVTVVALSGMRAQILASDRFESLTKIRNDLSSLIISNMDLYEQLNNLNDETYEAFLFTLNTDTEHFSKIISRDIELADNPDAEILLTAISEHLGSYSNSLNELVTLKKTIGFNATSGLMGDIWTAGENVLEKITSLSMVKQVFMPAREAEKNFIFEPTQENFAIFEARYSKFYDRFINFGLNDRYGDLVSAYHNKVKEYGRVIGDLNGLEQKFQNVRNEYSQATNDAQKLLDSQVLAARRQAAEQSQQASISVIVVSVIVAVLAGLIMLWIGRSVNQSLSNIVRDLNKVKNGDLTARLQVNAQRNDEFDSLCSSVNEMTIGLGSLVGDVVHTTYDVSERVGKLKGAVGNIASTNRSVTEQTNMLAAATEEISTTIMSITSTTDELSEQSNSTYESAKVGSNTIKGVLFNLGETISVVNKTGQQLNDLGQLSKNIDNVIAMINELANQTNLLALNAAIEAARAGEAGRGFSVVADEVRSLAEKTVDATAKITDIVGAIQVSTQSAINTMSSGQENLRSIEDLSEKAELAIQEIEQNALIGSTSSVEMARSIQEVAKTAAHMSKEMDRIAQQLRQDSGDIDSIEGSTRHIHDHVSALKHKTSIFTTT